MALKIFKEDRRRENFNKLIAPKAALVTLTKPVTENKLTEKTAVKATKMEKTDVSRSI